MKRAQESLRPGQKRAVHQIWQAPAGLVRIMGRVGLSALDELRLAEASVLRAFRIESEDVEPCGVECRPLALPDF